MLKITFLFATAICVLLAFPSSARSARPASACDVHPLLEHVDPASINPFKLFVNPAAKSVVCLLAVNSFWYSQPLANQETDELGPYIVLQANRLARQAVVDGNRSMAMRLWKLSTAANDHFKLAYGAREALSSSPDTVKDLINGQYSQAFCETDASISGEIFGQLLDRTLMPSRAPAMIDALSEACKGKFIRAQSMFSRLAHALPRRTSNPESWFFLGGSQLALHEPSKAYQSFLECSVRWDAGGLEQLPIVTWPARCAYVLSNTSTLKY